MSTADLPDDRDPTGAPSPPPAWGRGDRPGPPPADGDKLVASWRGAPAAPAPPSPAAGETPAARDTRPAATGPATPEAPVADETPAVPSAEQIRTARRPLPTPPGATAPPTGPLAAAAPPAAPPPATPPLAAAPRSAASSPATPPAANPPQPPPTTRQPEAPPQPVEKPAPTSPRPGPMPAAAPWPRAASEPVMERPGTSAGGREGDAASPARPPVPREQARVRTPEPPPGGDPLVFDRPQGAPTPPEGGGTRVFRPGLRSGIAVAAVAVLVAGGVTYLVRDGGHGGGHEDAPGAEAADKVFAVPAALYDGHEQTVTAVAVHGDTAVTVGSETVDAPRGQILVSSDGGKAWSTAKVKDEGGTGQDVPEVVAAGDRAWAALGRGPGGVAVWTSADGRTWTHRAGATGAFTAGDQVTGVAATSAGFAAIGTNQGAAILWTSSDGAAWQRRQAPLQGKPVSIAAGGATLVVRNDKGDLWRSADGGGTWARAEVPQSDGSYGPVVALTSGPGGFFAAREGRRTGGSSKNPKKRALAVFFRSSDGAGWTRSSTIDRRTYAGLAALGGSDAGLAALTPLTDGRVAAQRSKDGVNWESVERLGTDQGRRAGAAAPLPQGVLVAGRQDSGAYLAAPGARHGDIDLLSVPGAVTPDRTITRLVTGNGAALAVGSGAGEAAVWTTRDGRAWTRAGGTGLTGPGVQRLAAAAYGPKGWVAAGRSAAKPLLLTSGDANAWSAAAGPAGDDGALAGAAYGPAGYVVVGSTDEAPLAWRSDDLVRWTAGSGDLRDGKMHDVAAVTKGYVAVGERDGAPAVWTSDDGAKWTSVQPPQAQGPLTRVVARGDTLVATGAGGTVAVSSDAGRTWRAQTVQASALAASLATPRGFVLAGTPAGTDDVALWSSADGASWRATRPRGARLAGEGSQRLTGLAVLGQGLVATGMDGGTPTLWHTALP